MREGRHFQSPVYREPDLRGDDAVAIHTMRRGNRVGGKQGAQIGDGESWNRPTDVRMNAGTQDAHADSQPDEGLSHVRSSTSVLCGCILFHQRTNASGRR